MFQHKLSVGISRLKGNWNRKKPINRERHVKTPHAEATAMKIERQNWTLRHFPPAANSFKMSIICVVQLRGDITRADYILLSVGNQSNPQNQEINAIGAYWLWRQMYERRSVNFLNTIFICGVWQWDREFSTANATAPSTSNQSEARIMLEHASSKQPIWATNQERGSSK